MNGPHCQVSARMITTGASDGSLSHCRLTSPGHSRLRIWFRNPKLLLNAMRAVKPTTTGAIIMGTRIPVATQRTRW